MPSPRPRSSTGRPRRRRDSRADPVGADANRVGAVGHDSSTRPAPTHPKHVRAATGAKPDALPDLVSAVLTALETNERVNRLLIESLDDAAWRAEPPGGKGRTIAAIVAHIHNVRHMWLVVMAKGTEPPPKLNRATVTRSQAVGALARSHDALAALIGPTLRGEARLRGFGAGPVSFAAYVIAHDAHHRGQICAQARMVGHPLPQQVTFALWEWGRRAPEARPGRAAPAHKDRPRNPAG